MIPVLDAQFYALPSQLYTRQNPANAPCPELVVLNEALADSLGLDVEWLYSKDGIAMLAGNFIPPDAKPLAQAYAGHQFGHWAGLLGDGRAILLGELKDKKDHIFDLHLKGAGPTPYARGGDGYCALGPALREYIVSEALYALDIPTTRTLGIVKTGRTIYRDKPCEGAIVARIASSHVRVGTFQHINALQDDNILDALLAYVKTRHYPQMKNATDLLYSVIRKQAALIAQWMGVGFIHGVMNTDNMAISGETIDFGPCAFLDEYHPLKVFSFIDKNGRYAFSKQADIALWNLTQFARALLGHLGKNQDEQYKIAGTALEEFANVFNAKWLKIFAAKIGISHPIESDRALIFDLLNHFAANESDFTQGFRTLENNDNLPLSWREKWLARRVKAGGKDVGCVNPQIIPRNHQIERAIHDGEAGDFNRFYRLNKALSTPFSLHHQDIELALPPSLQERVPYTFCGT